MKVTGIAKLSDDIVEPDKIARHFGDHAAGYDRFADLQRQTARDLADRLPAAGNISSVLELGCGTGFLTGLLQAKYPEASLLITDLSEDMLEQCGKNIRHSSLSFGRLDASCPPVDMGPFDLIVSSMTFQWLADPVGSLKNWQQKLTSAGRLYYCAPAPGSFMQWRHVLKQMNLPAGLLAPPHFPGQQEVIPYIRHYANTRSFFTELKVTGASLPRPGYSPLKAGQLRRAMQLLDAQGTPLQISWNIQYGCLPAIDG